MYPKGHRATDLPGWLEAALQMAGRKEEGCRSPADFRRIDFEEGYEPFVLAFHPYLPAFDTRFQGEAVGRGHDLMTATVHCGAISSQLHLQRALSRLSLLASAGYGRNKVIWSLQLHTRGFQFVVHPALWVYHAPHPPSRDKVRPSNYEYCTLRSVRAPNMSTALLNDGIALPSGGWQLATLGPHCDPARFQRIRGLYDSARRDLLLLDGPRQTQQPPRSAVVEPLGYWEDARSSAQARRLQERGADPALLTSLYELKFRFCPLKYRVEPWPAQEGPKGWPVGWKGTAFKGKQNT